MIEKLDRKGRYPLGDRFPAADLRLQMYLRGMWDGEKKRAPKKGEWYLSGSPIATYRAPNDFTQVFHIAKIVEVRTETKVIDVRTL